MNTFRYPVRIAAAALACLGLSPSKAAEPKLPRDGWVSWEVSAVESAPAWCCFEGWDRHNSPQASCKLDERSHSFGTTGENKTTDAVKIYARTADGKIDRLQALSATCPVETKTSVQQLGDVSQDDSVRWLTAQAKQDGRDSVNGEPISGSALAALAMHRGDLAANAMADFARKDARRETRKRAVFWLSQVRGVEGADITSSVMFNDQDSEVREHAAFALSQSKAPRVAPDLIRLGNTDKVGEVRAQAWFWLAQNGATGAEQAIVAALRKDADDDVRERAIAALAQLPDDRAAKALIAAVEDQSLSGEQRKRAMFWLSQSESPAALAYLDKVFMKIAQ